MSNKFGERLKLVRKEKGYTQQRLCNQVNEMFLNDKGMSITRNSITMYETGERKPRYDVVVAISHILDVDIDFLMGLSDKQHMKLGNFALTDFNSAILALLEKDDPEKNVVLYTLLNNLKDVLSLSSDTNDLIRLNNLIYNELKRE